MRAVLANVYGGPEVLRVVEVPVPEPGPLQVRVLVEAAAVNAVDLATRSGLLCAAGLHADPPVRLGWDVLGRVDALGADVRRLVVGQRVIGMSDRLSAPSKTHAEAVVLDEAAVAAVPVELDASIGATLPLAGLTALQALDRLDLSPGQSVVVTGAGGSVGSLAVQLAGLRGLRVIAVGRATDEAPALAVGAAEFVESGVHFAEVVRRLVPGGVDGAIDTAGLGHTSLDTVRTGGAHISLNVLDRPAPLRRVRSESLAVAAHWEQLTLLAALAATGGLHVSIAEELELHLVQKAHELLAVSGLRGRVLLRP